MKDIVPHTVAPKAIKRKIYVIRGQKVMLDRDLAALYGVPTKRLNEQVRRNLRRFPSDFMFQLGQEELENWRSHFASSNPAAKMGLRRPPFAFTVLGVSMLSSVLNSERAIQMNIHIMRAFTRLNRILFTDKDLAMRFQRAGVKFAEQDRKIAGQDHKIADHSRQLTLMSDTLKRFTEIPEDELPKIGLTE
jgi:hypothetical protein